MPLAQVLTYTLGSGNALGSAGDIEVEFNYKTGVNTTLPASFTLAGVTFSATSINSGFESDFLFSSSGAFKGSIRGDFGSATLADSLPGGWSIKSTGGGGGTVSAPELDASTGAAALALLFAGIAVLRGRRRA